MMTSLFYLLLCWQTSCHEYHSSIAEIRYIANKQVIQVTLRLFNDDLEAGMKKHLGLKTILLDNTKKYEQAISEYAFANFQIQNAKKLLVKGTYIGKEQKDEYMTVYMEFPAKGFSSKWQVRNLILTEVYNDQNNIVNFFQGDASRSAKTTLFRQGAAWADFL